MNLGSQQVAVLVEFDQQQDKANYYANICTKRKPLVYAIYSHCAPSGCLSTEAYDKSVTYVRFSQ
jgi:hypothetical protein